MKYLDKQAERIMKLVRVELMRLLPEPWTVSTVDPESPYASERGDRGACVYIEGPGGFEADARVEIPDSEGYDGTREGWGFGFACTSDGGCIGPGWTMYNYSDRVWTRDRTEIRERLEALEAGAEDFAVSVAEWVQEEAAEKAED